MSKSTEIVLDTSALEVQGDYYERHLFENGYGVSIIRHDYSYGGSAGYFEVAVLDRTGELTYDTPVTDDVIGWLSPAGVLEVMQQVAALPEAPRAALVE